MKKIYSLILIFVLLFNNALCNDVCANSLDSFTISNIELGYNYKHPSQIRYIYQKGVGSEVLSEAVTANNYGNKDFLCNVIEGNGPAGYYVLCKIKHKVYKCKINKEGKFVLYVPAYWKAKKIDLKLSKTKNTNKVIKKKRIALKKKNKKYDSPVTSYSQKMKNGGFNYKWIMKTYVSLLRKEFTEYKGYPIRIITKAYSLNLETNTYEEVDAYKQYYMKHPSAYLYSQWEIGFYNAHTLYKHPKYKSSYITNRSIAYYFFLANKEHYEENNILEGFYEEVTLNKDYIHSIDIFPEYVYEGKNNYYGAMADDLKGHYFTYQFWKTSVINDKRFIREDGSFYLPDWYVIPERSIWTRD